MLRDVADEVCHHLCQHHVTDGAWFGVTTLTILVAALSRTSVYRILGETREIFDKYQIWIEILCLKL